MTFTKAQLRKGGKRGGKARHKALSPERRQEIARHAAMVRWTRYRELMRAD